jgi:hypothetical protein
MYDRKQVLIVIPLQLFADLNAHGADLNAHGAETICAYAIAA